MDNHGSPQDLANAVWAFAAQKVPCPTLLAGIERRATWLVDNGTPQNVSNTLWSFATLGIRCPGVVLAVESRGPWLEETGQKQDVEQPNGHSQNWDFHAQDYSNREQRPGRTIMPLDVQQPNGK